MKLYQVDAFTDTLFRGNPAAVCPLESMLPDETLQAIAREMNLSETAFITPQGSDWHLRWFTPLKEVELCGHATLATAHILWQEGYLPSNHSARFHTLSGLLIASPHAEGIEMQFPRGALAQGCAAHPALLAALGLKDVVFFGSYRPNRYLIEISLAADVAALQPNFSVLKELGADRIMVTARADQEPYDFVSRYFAPGAGIDEDPVTGSAHCFLTPYWSQKLNKTRMRAYQASARGGSLSVELQDKQVLIRGQAVTVFRGELLLSI